MPFVEAKKTVEVIQQEWKDDPYIDGVPNPTEHAPKLVALIAAILAGAASFALVYGLTQIILSLF